MLRIWIALVVASTGCGMSVGICYSEGNMTRGEDRDLAIYTERLFQALPSGEVPAVALGPGMIQAAYVKPCNEHSLERVPPDKVVSVTFDPPELATFVGDRFDHDLIKIGFDALTEGDGTITVRAVFDGDTIEDTRAFRVRALHDIFYDPIDRNEVTTHGPFVAGTELAAFPYPTTASGEPLESDTPNPGWKRPDGQLEIVDYPWPSETEVGVKFPVAGTIAVRLGTHSDWSWERTVPQTSVEVVPVSAITSSELKVQSLNGSAMSCPVGSALSIGTTLRDGSGQTIHGAAALVVASDPTALDIHLGEDPDDLLVVCKASGDFTLSLALPNAPATLTVRVP